MVFKSDGVGGVTVVAMVLESSFHPYTTILLHDWFVF